MIARNRPIAAAVAIALAAVSPARAQEAAPPDSDLRCAVWSAMALGANEDAEVATGFSMALVWFLARYEAATGKPYEEALTPEYVEGLTTQVETIDLECQPRMRDMGLRLEAWGQKLEESGL